MGGQQAEEQPGRVPPSAGRVLRRLGLDHNHSHINAPSGVLPLSVHGLSIRDMETCLQDAIPRSLDISKHVLKGQVPACTMTCFNSTFHEHIFIKLSLCRFIKMILPS